jgi:hypothetical protein
MPRPPPTSSHRAHRASSSGEEATFPKATTFLRSEVPRIFSRQGPRDVDAQKNSFSRSRAPSLPQGEARSVGGDGRGGWRAPASARRRGGHRGVRERGGGEPPGRGEDAHSGAGIQARGGVSFRARRILRPTSAVPDPRHAGVSSEVPDHGQPAPPAPAVRARVRGVHVLVRRAAQDRAARGRARVVSGHERRAAGGGAHGGHLSPLLRLRQRVLEAATQEVKRHRAPRAFSARGGGRGEPSLRRAVRRAAGSGADKSAGEPRRRGRGSSRGPIRGLDQPQRRRARGALVGAEKTT